MAKKKKKKAVKRAKKKQARKPRDDRQFDLLSALKGRDAALDQVAENAGDEFMDGGIEAIAHLPIGVEVMGEDMRRSVVQAGYKPHHPNAWGALVNRAIKLGLITPTGRFRAPRSVKSHGCRKAVYIREESTDAT
jgi:hypothetical protein